jgi:hypothetical protein
MLFKFLFAGCFLLIISLESFSETRIGTFDSRSVAIVYARTKMFQTFTDSLINVKRKATKDGNTKLAQTIDKQFAQLQISFHEQGFGTASVSYALAFVKDSLVTIAKDSNLTAIVSKWELPYTAKDCKCIDITERVIKLFKPDEKTLKMALDIIKTAPIKDAGLIEE